MRNRKRARSERPVQPLPLPPRIKICGLTRPDEAVSAVIAGAEAIGLIHDPRDPRSLSAVGARRIVKAVEGRALTVAVLIDADPDEALRFVEQSGAGAVQLGGVQRPEDWVGFPCSVLRRLTVDGAAEYALDAWRDVATQFVLTASPGARERTVDSRLARNLALRAPCLLGGGLSESDVEDRITEVQPYGVDASSRLELSPGRKDPVQVHAFVLRAREALGTSRHREAG